MDQTGSTRYPENITWEAALQATACAQGLGSYVGHLCASSVRGSDIYLSFTLQTDQHLEGVPEASKYRQPEYNSPGGKAHQGSNAPKSRAAYQQSVPGETQSSSGTEIAL